MIYRHENGLINTPLESLTSELSLLLNEKGIGTTATSIKDSYMWWVSKMRDFTGRRLVNTNLFLGPRADINPYRAEHPFVTLMNNVTWAVGIQTGISPDVLRSQQLFNRLLCLHPKAAQDIVGKKGYYITGVLRTALSEIGFTDVKILALQECIEKWHEVNEDANYGVRTIQFED
jgi:hypothetical protein